MIELYCGIGDRVNIGGVQPKGIEAVVTGVCIRGEGNITYECAWIHGGQRYTDWFTRKEIRRKSQGARPTLGFASAEAS